MNTFYMYFPFAAKKSRERVENLEWYECIKRWKYNVLHDFINSDFEYNSDLYVRIYGPL